VISWNSILNKKEISDRKHWCQLCEAKASKIQANWILYLNPIGSSYAVFVRARAYICSTYVCMYLASLS